MNGGIRGNRPKLRGTGVPRPQPVQPKITPAKEKKRVLFVCIGNSCRSQMAEAFARAYGSDIVIPQSAGLSPAATIAPLTRQVLGEKNLNTDVQFPKGLEYVSRERFDLVINISGRPLPPISGAPVREWAVVDPIGQKESVYRDVAKQIEDLIMRLILELRNAP